MPHIYCAITHHGYGHAARTLGLLRSLRQALPGLRITLNCAAPPAFIAAQEIGNYEARIIGLDCGITQADSVNMDLPATLLELERIRTAAPELIRSEGEYCRRERVDLVLADIPPLAAEIAALAQVPAVMVGNFGWDFIYRDLGAQFAPYADWYAQMQARSTMLLRLPFCEPMASFPAITDVGLLANTPRYSPQEIRRRLLLPNKPIILIVFGGLGLGRVPWENLAAFDGRRAPDYHFIIFDNTAPPGANRVVVPADSGLRPVDIMPLCDAVFTKPGYSTFAEACLLGKPLIVLERHGFAETELLMRALRAYFRHRMVTFEEFHSDNWDFLSAPLTPPQEGESIDRDGNNRIRRILLEMLGEDTYNDNP